MQGNKEDYSFDLIDTDCCDPLPTKKNELIHKFLKILTEETKQYTYKELVAEFKYNFEHSRRICIKLFTVGKIERIKLLKRFGDLTLNIGNIIPTFGGIE